MLNLKSVACRIAARPSPHLTLPIETANRADYDMLGMTAPGSDPSLSTTSVCGHKDSAAGVAAAHGNGRVAAAAGAGAGVPKGVAVGTQARVRRGDAAMADALDRSDRMEATSQTLPDAPGDGPVSAALEPGTPNDISDPEDIEFMEEQVCALYYFTFCLPGLLHNTTM